MENETIFVDGMIFKSKRDGAPDFVLGSISIKVEELVPFLEKHKKDGWVNIDFLRGKPKNEGEKGKPYFKLNTWKPENSTVSDEKSVNPDEDKEDIPF